MTAFLEYTNVVPLLAPADITTTVTATPYMALKTALKAGFLVVLGNVDSGTTTDTEVITVEAATAEGGTEAAVAFRYRLSGAVGANTWGAVTTADTTGLAIGVTDDNKVLYIEIDPDELAASDYAVVRLKFTDTPDMANFLVSVLGLIQPRYKQTTYVSATASASA